MVDDLKQKLLNIANSLNPSVQVDERQGSVPFDELGFDSLDVANLLLQAEEATGIHVPDEEAGNLTTLDTFYNWLVAHQ